MSKIEFTNDDVRLESIDIDGYRSCLNTKFYPNRGLSALIGINGAGKTNILQGIRLLELRRSRPGRRVMEDLSRSPEAEVTAWFIVNDERIGLKMKFSLIQSSRREDEHLSISETWNLQSFTKSRAWREIPPLDFIMEGDHVLIGSKQLYLFDHIVPAGSRVRWMKDFDEIIENKKLTQSLIAINKFRSSITYYSASQFTDPTRCPSSFEVDEDGRLSDSFANISSTHIKFLHDLYRLRAENEELYNRYSDFVSRKQLGLVSRMTWKEIELSSNSAEVKSGGGVKKIRKTKILVIPKVQIGSSYITFNQLSEGTFKTLALVFYIFTDASKFLMIEEPEVCVHHGLLARVVATLKAHSSIKQTVISTHSDQLLDSLLPENVFVVEMARNGTKVENLESWLDGESRRALHDYLAESGPLGEYWRSGGLS